MKRYILLILSVALSLNLFAAEKRVLKGTVLCGEVGVANVVVTDGENFTTTDDKGHYKLESDDDNELVYITVPAGYTVESKNSVPMFWHKVKGGHDYDFTLIKKEQDDAHHGFVVIADPQIWHKKEFPALQEGMKDINESVKRYKIPFHGICCGDIVSHDHSFYEQYNAIAAESGLTFFSTLGNHDMTLYGRTHETSTRLWEETFGPVCYSFNVGKAHYVVLNDNFYIGRDYFYIGYLDEKQFAWLEKDLSYVEPGSTVFVILHIPATCEPDDRKQFKYGNIANVMTNALQLHRMLAPYKGHILSGHTHTTYNQIINDNLYEHVIPALSGAWWQGTLCTDGTPRGYGVFEVKGDEVSWYYKSTACSPDHQMSLYSGADYDQFQGTVVANIWAVDERWSVEAQLDGGKWQPMERFSAYDPGAQQMYADREKLDHPYVYPSVSDHFFKVAVPTDVKQVTVKATDPFGRTYTQTINLD